MQHIQTYSGIISAYSEPCHIQNSGIFSILANSKPEGYPEPWYIQNSGTFRTRDIQNPGLVRTLRYSEPESYSEPCQTSTIERFEKELTTIIIFATSAFPVLCFMKDI